MQPQLMQPLGGAADSAAGEGLDEDAAAPSIMPSSGGLGEDACDGDLDGSPRIFLWWRSARFRSFSFFFCVFGRRGRPAEAAGGAAFSFAAG